MKVCIYVGWLCLLFSAAADAQTGVAEQSGHTSKSSLNNMVVFISHPQNNAVTISDIKPLYTLSRKLLPNGNNAALSILPLKRKESVQAFRFLLGLYPYQVQRTWDRAVFSGKGTSPTIFEDSAALIAHVSANEGAIGYVLVPNESAFNKLKETVNVIAIVE